MDKTRLTDWRGGNINTSRCAISNARTTLYHTTPHHTGPTPYHTTPQPDSNQPMDKTRLTHGEEAISIPVGGCAIPNALHYTTPHHITTWLSKSNQSNQPMDKTRLTDWKGGNTITSRCAISNARTTLYHTTPHHTGPTPYHTTSQPDSNQPMDKTRLTHGEEAISIPVGGCAIPNALHYTTPHHTTPQSDPGRGEATSIPVTTPHHITTLE
jgi:hypothetical protein